ncbi:hypothetical protein PIIN_01943 [Serendipita indica DSM 11827]|uniref:Uncharacterized protein n=1 Tax=Serendipita indica (strain DSM 11827) TaxID=1109443 RepID=G4T9S6_SERID|nr:hypothetical protein PIIN_01943 [Serendipita indica DSM 11827]
MSLSATDEPQITDLEAYVMSEEFDQDCHALSIKAYAGFRSGYPEYVEPLSNEDADSVASSPHDPSKLEAYLYYFGIRGPNLRGPKLIYRNSIDKYIPPSPGNQPREMQLLTVDEHPQLDQNNTWATVASEIVRLLKERNIQYSTVDLVRFSWIEEPEEDESFESDESDQSDKAPEVNETHDDEKGEEHTDIDEFEIAFHEHGKRYTTPVTIWIGVVPDTLTGQVAFNCSNEIEDLLKRYEILDIDIAFREGITSILDGPPLYSPVSNVSPLKDVIDPLTTALGLPIAGLKSLNRQGTLGAFFRWQDKYYGFTARHVLFPLEEGNKEYDYSNSSPKKKVVVLGSREFDDLLDYIQGQIGAHNRTIPIMENAISILATRSQEDDFTDQTVLNELKEQQNELEKTRTKIIALKDFYVQVKSKWFNPLDRVIGHVVWAPPISTATPPDGYTKDLCVIELDKRKFANFGGNVLDLGVCWSVLLQVSNLTAYTKGPEIEPGTFASLVDPPLKNRRPEFHYPGNRLLKLKGIFFADRMSNKYQNSEGDNICHVIKRGAATNTTIGNFSKYESHICHYYGIAEQKSTQAAIHSYDNKSNPFSKLYRGQLSPFSARGDSGSIIVDAQGRYVALLTSGVGSTASTDITFGTPFHWLWEIIKKRFPGASLYFDD